VFGRAEASGLRGEGGAAQQAHEGQGRADGGREGAQGAPLLQRVPLRPRLAQRPPALQGHQEPADEDPERPRLLKAHLDTTSSFLLLGSELKL